MNPDELPFLRAAIQSIAMQRNAALDAAATIEGNLVVLKGKLDEANKRIAELTSPKDEEKQE